MFKTAPGYLYDGVNIHELGLQSDSLFKHLSASILLDLDLHA